MSARDDVLDLSARARRGEATGEELKRLRAGLGASPTLRAVHQLGVDFDAVLSVKAADAELVDAIVAHALSASSTKRSRTGFRRGRSVRWLVVAAALLCTAGALALWRDSAKVVPSPVAPGAAASTKTRVVPVKPAAVAASRPPESTEAPLLIGVPSPSPPSSAAVPMSGAAIETAGSADALFAQANQARSSGRGAEAIALYRRLQANHPTSAEALTSRIALGRLLLDRGEPTAALREFDRHLGSGGALAEEALLWKARTLKQLGRRNEEEQVLRSLLQRFPHTAYEHEAQSRLGSAEPAND